MPRQMPAQQGFVTKNIHSATATAIHTTIQSFLPSANHSMASLRFFSPPPSLPFFSNSSPPRSLSLPFRSISTHALLRAHRSPTFPSESTLQEFSQWLTASGAVSSSSAPVKPSVVLEGLGLVAQRNLPQNEVVVEIPKKLWIDSDTVAASDIGRYCGGLRPWVSIALFLLREKARGDDSPWRPYLDILPQETDSTIFWSEEELSEIQGTQLLSTTMGVKEYVQSEFAKVEQTIILPNKNLFPSTITFPDFLWAFGVLRSRAFSRMRGDNLALIPLADLINHSGKITTEDTSWEIKGKGLFSREVIFSLRTPVPVKSGEQVYIQYDLEKSNAELALDYGFIESRSNREAYTLTLEISESDPFYGDKLVIAESNGLGETAYFDIVLGSPLPPLVLPYLRLIALGGADAFLLESIFSNTIWGHLELPVSPANEETVCRVVRDACKSALSAYQTTIEEDEELMRSGDLDSRHRVAVGIRAGEKKVLQQIDDIFRERELELDGLEYYQERRLRDLGLACEQDDIIFWESR